MKDLLEENAKLREQLAAAQASPMSEEAMDILRSRAEAAEAKLKEAIPDGLVNELKQLRSSLISWRTKCYPHTDQVAVVDRGYPIIAMLVAAPKPEVKP